jgi:nucleotide-binding universal stress UspA family protein
MTARSRRAFAVRRIIVAADSSPHGRAAMEAAATLAAELGAEVEGLFVEDVNLFNVAELALGRELHLISGRARAFDRAALESELRTEAAQARRALETLAGRWHVSVSFRVVRGRVEAEVITAAGTADLLVLGTASRPLGAHRRPGSTAVAAAERAPGSVLLLRPGGSITGRALVAYDGSEGAELALEAGVRVTAGRKDALTVLLVAPTAEEAAALRGKLEGQLASRGVTPRLLHVPALELAEMCRLTRETRTDVLILSADNKILSETGHTRLLAEAGCPILLVR